MTIGNWINIFNTSHLDWYQACLISSILCKLFLPPNFPPQTSFPVFYKHRKYSDQKSREKGRKAESNYQPLSGKRDFSDIHLGLVSNCLFWSPLCSVLSWVHHGFRKKVCTVRQEGRGVTLYSSPLWRGQRKARTLWPLYCLNWSGSSIFKIIFFLYCIFFLTHNCFAYEHIWVLYIIK